MNSVANKTYIVTGGASGIGLATVAQILELGGSALAVDLSREALDKLPSLFGARSDRLETLALDVTISGNEPRMVEAALARFGRIDGLVASAGRIKIRPLQDVTREEWDGILALNLTSVFFYARAVAEHIKKAGHPGAIVTISSTSAHGPRPNNPDYGASKLGIDHVTRTLALEYAPSQIRVNSVSPGVIETAMWKAVDRDRGAVLGLASGDLTKRMNQATPIGRVGQPEEIANIIIFLLSDRSSFITGQVIEADGGFKLANP